MRKIFAFLYQNFAKALFFMMEPEDIHERMSKFGNLLGRFRLTKFITRLIFNHRDLKLEQVVDGISYRNPVGLSAGFDKDANLVSILGDVGFSFMNIGSVTYKPYEGNPKPRLYRLIESKAVVVYYGLKNLGVEVISERIKKSTNDIVKGISVAKTNCDATSTTQGGIDDYVATLKYLEKSAIGDFYTINISCPNTFGGEPFTTPDKLELLMKEISSLNITKPVYVKMPINLMWDEFNSLLEVLIKHNTSGVIIGNLTKVRDPNLILDEIPENVQGGISGLPTQQLCDHLISNTYKKYGDKLTIIGVGGIFSAEDAYRKIKYGASLVQLITGMIFEGPQLIGQINSDIVKMLERDGFNNISEAIGSHHATGNKDKKD